MKNNIPILSICIPTYNRAECLARSLDRLQREIKNVGDAVELIVSDNCSEDNTAEVVRRAITEYGLRCNYIRNQTNIGMDRNFLQCIMLANGLYTWILGDDDFLVDGMLSYICSILNEKQIGLLHLENNKQSSCTIHEYTSLSDYLSCINVNITFLSANIFLTSARDYVVGEDYIGTYLLQVPYYLSAASGSGSNLIVSGYTLDCGVASESNGGYNFANVFFDNFIAIINQCLCDNRISKESLYSIKRSTFVNFYLPYIIRSIVGKPSQSLDMRRCVLTSLKYYWKEPYYYKKIAAGIIKWVCDSVRRRLSL